MTRKTPAQKPHRSRQDYATPPELLEAVWRRFGRITLDLAARADNAVVPRHFGPDAQVSDSLTTDWCNELAPSGLWWLNPPYENIGKWAAKCAEQRASGARIALLVPAAVGAGWYRKHVAPHAYVFVLNPRVAFVGEASGYVKDLILALYEPVGYRGFEPWNWLADLTPYELAARKERLRIAKGAALERKRAEKEAA